MATHLHPPRTWREELGPLALRLVATAAIAGTAAAVAPTREAAPILAVVAAVLSAIALLPAAGRVPSYVWAPVAGALVAVAVGPASLTAGVIAGELLAHLDVPILILALAYLSISLDDSGFFDWCSRRILRGSAGSGPRLFLLLFFGVSAVTFVTSNDIVILSMTPILVYTAAHARIRNLTPFLIVLFVAANTASMGLYVGNPTNIVIAGASGVDFVSYAGRMLIPTLVAMVSSLAVLWLLFGFAGRDRIPATFHHAGVEARPWTRAMTIKVVLFACCLAAMGALGHPWSARVLLGSDDPRGVTHVIVAVAVAFALLAAAWDVRTDLSRGARATWGEARRRLGRLPLEIVPFFLSFCVLLTAADQTGLARLAADHVVRAFQNGPVIGALATGAYGVLTVNGMNNIPASILFEKVWLGGLPRQLGKLNADVFLDTSLFASNFGANLTFVGALAGLMWLRIVREMAARTPGVRRFPTGRDFVRYGLVVVPFVTIVTCVSIALCRMVSP